MEILIIAIIIIAVIVFVFSKRWDYSQTDILPYKRKEYLLNIPERKFFEQIQSILPEEYVIYPQVLLSSIIWVHGDKKSFRKRQNKINRKTIDFVIFERQYLKPIWAIEYDGKTHQKPDRAERDSFVDEVLQSAWISIHHHKHNWWNFSAVEQFIQLLWWTSN